METPLPYIECLEPTTFDVKISPSFPDSEATVMLSDYVERTLSADIEVGVADTGENGMVVGATRDTGHWMHAYLIPTAADSGLLAVTYCDEAPDAAAPVGVGVPFRYIGTIVMNNHSSADGDFGFTPMGYCGNQALLYADGSNSEYVNARSFTDAALTKDTWATYDPASNDPSMIPTGNVAGELLVQITMTEQNGTEARPIYMLGSETTPTTSDYPAVVMDPNAVACDDYVLSGGLLVSQMSLGWFDDAILHWVARDTGTDTATSGPMTITIKGFTDKYL